MCVCASFFSFYFCNFFFPPFKHFNSIRILKLKQENWQSTEQTLTLRRLLNSKCKQSIPAHIPKGNFMYTSKVGLPHNNFSFCCCTQTKLLAACTYAKAGRHRYQKFLTTLTSKWWRQNFFVASKCSRKSNST